MGEKSKKEIIYIQRYETFRHLDRLRWLMFQIAIATSGAIIAVFRNFGKLYYFPLLSIGSILLLTGISMRRINLGIVKNGEFLHKIGKEVGDSEIPLPQFNVKSIAWWISWLMIIVGIVLIISWACLFALMEGGNAEAQR